MTFTRKLHVFQNRNYFFFIHCIRLSTEILLCHLFATVQNMYANLGEPEQAPHKRVYVASMFIWYVSYTKFMHSIALWGIYSVKYCIA